METQHGNNLHVIEKVGDIFDAPRRSVLIHACNAVGSWGGGIALAFRERYPDAYRIYNTHCKRSLPHRLVGTALLIAPRGGTRREHYVGCLFTSKRFGRNKDSPSDILAATEPAMLDLIQQILSEMAGEEVGELRICHINSGLFAVPWTRSKILIENLQVGEEDIPEGVTFSREIVAYAPE
ncbi:ADP-ribose 1''-phosphate phosphatase [Immersiella caudata]|uniref:ADP-ribose 1''-phosphate phosphatase n=1 Tax=Immersiella caudata TaxID=314043 RepID=A0AA39X3U4_9PEZI|nr:ADP-ribose 1''-phosphate phosphatase [Immersiella caudata]